MNPAVLPSAFALSAAAVMAVTVALRREKTVLHWLLLTLLGALMTWTAGVVCRFSVDSEAGLQASVRLIFFGVFATPPLWLLLADRYARTKVLTGRSINAALMLPSALAYLALLTNEGHRLVMREVSFETFAESGRAWAGPAFWVFLAWAYACMLGGVILYLVAARRMVDNGERRRGLVLALASLLPLLTSSVYVFGLLPIPVDLTPLAVGIALVLTSTAVFRDRFVEGLPLARRDVIEHLRDGVVMADASGAVLDLNPAAERILGCAASKVRRRPLAVALGELSPEAEAADLIATLAQLDVGQGPRLAEIRTRDARSIEVSAACVRDGSGEAAGQFAVLRDRTEERRNERVARQTQRLETVGTLAAGVAHEVNNPLAFIRSNLSQIHRMGERVEQEMDGPDAKLAKELADLREIAAETLDGIGRIEKIVSDMRRLSTEPPEAFVTLDVNRVVADAIRLANLGRDAGVGVEIETSLSEALPPVEGSPERLAQALINLLVNAQQAVGGSAGGRITVKTGCDGEGVSIRVADNGPGIPDEVQERIFDPFFTTKTPDRGTGLGLSIALDILRDHGGALEVWSRPGEGAVFTARIPIR